MGFSISRMGPRSSAEDLDSSVLDLWGGVLAWGKEKNLPLIELTGFQ